MRKDTKYEWFLNVRLKSNRTEATDGVFATANAHEWAAFGKPNASGILTTTSRSSVTLSAVEASL